MYPKTGQRGADVSQTAMLTALSFNLSPSAEGVCWRGWMWAVTVCRIHQPARWGRPCQHTQVPTVASHHCDLRVNPELRWLGWESSMFCLGQSIFSLLLFSNYYFQLCCSFLYFPPSCYPVNVWAWTIYETLFRHCFHLTVLYIILSQKIPQLVKAFVASWFCVDQTTSHKERGIRVGCGSCFVLFVGHLWRFPLPHYIW